MAKPEKQTSPVPKLLWGIACILIIGAIAGGLLITGGPQEERMRRMDNRRINDLQQLENVVVDAYRTNHQLPELLAALKTSNPHLAEATRDPVTDKPYGYRKTSDATFQLCATFERDSRREESSRYNGNAKAGYSLHPAGEHCFILKKETGKENQNDRWIQFRVE